MEVVSEQVENRESRDTARHLAQPMRESSNLLLDLGLPERDAGVGARLNMRVAARSMGHDPYQVQDQVAPQQHRRRN
jgi:hypothetical protein